ncbi:hypothetical protein [Rhizobium leguminosarum]|uniref:hypothetical protein n=1 Tax=Rhizobium leguminosarum TaxID=384 RepID=UPI002E128FE0|nr:hypothetical protein U8Q02_38025 [Rhizobium leguminosarum]
MRQEVYDLIDAVRALGLELTPEEDRPVRVTGDRSEFPFRLEQLQMALEAFDSAEAHSDGDDVPEPHNDPKRLKEALDGVMRLLQLAGGNLQDAVDIVQTKLGVESEKKKKGYETLPFFAPDRIRRRSRYKPRLRLLPERPEDVTFDDLRKMAFEVGVTEKMVGDTYRTSRHSRDQDVIAEAASTRLSDLEYVEGATPARPSR